MKWNDESREKWMKKNLIMWMANDKMKEMRKIWRKSISAKRYVKIKYLMNRHNRENVKKKGKRSVISSWAIVKWYQCNIMTANVNQLLSKEANEMTKIEEKILTKKWKGEIISVSKRTSEEIS